MNYKLLTTLVCTLLFSLEAFAQADITGIVEDADTGELLPGVNVFVQELQRGDATDIDGEFAIENVEPGTYTLIATFVGYNRYQEIVEVGGQDVTLNIQLQTSVTTLQDVVVTAFGIEREQRSLGYGVSGVSAESIESRNESDIARALSGQLPGVSVQAAGGVTGSGTDMVIRGYASITGSNQPLFVVDGVAFDGSNNATSDWAQGGGQQSNPNRFLDLNPKNIESVTVLKGLSATVLYGEEGRNGVVLISTKSGSFDQDGPSGFDVTFDQSVYAKQISSRPDYQNTYGGGFDQNFGWFFSNWGPRFDTENPALFGSDFRGFDNDGTVLIEHPLIQHGPTAAAFPELQDVNYRYEAKPDPMEAFFRTGTAYNTSLSISGGVENVRVNVNYSRADEQGFTPNNNLGRNAFSVGTSYNILDNLTGQTIFNMGLTDVTSPPLAAGGGSGPAAVGGTTSVFGDVFYTPRSIDLSIPFENPVTGGSAYYRSGNDIPHPMWTAENVRFENSANRYYGKTELNYRPLEGVNVIYRVGYDSFNENQSYSQNPNGVRPEALLNGFYQTIEIAQTSWDQALHFLLDYQLTEDISFIATAGAQYATSKNLRNGVESQNMLIANFFEHANFINQSATNFFGGADFQRTIETQTAGVFADLGFGYQDFVYLNVVGRNDWFSTLEPENRSIFYPGASLSYIMSDHLDITSGALSYLKLYAGVGTSAGSPGAYSTRNVLSSNARAFIRPGAAGEVVVTSNATSDFLGNPELKPELHTEYEGGFDVRFLEGRFGLSASAYTRSTRDLITQAPIDPATGFTSTLVNIGEIKNDGLEITLTARPLTGPLQWNIQSNFFTSRSEVIELGAGLDRIQVGGGFTTRGNFAIEGEPFQVMLGTKIRRVTEEMVQDNPNFAGVEVGTPIVSSVGDYIEEDEIGTIGNPNPDWTFNIGNTFSYRSASLSFQIDYQQGGDMFSTWISTLMARGLTTDTDKVDRNNTFYLPGVNEQGQPNQVQISPSGVFFSNFGFGPDELRVYDMSHIRLSNVSLSYDLPASIIGNTPFSQVTLSVTGDNLWMKAFNVPEGSGFDPNVNSIGGNARGFEYLTGPAARTFGGNLKVRF